ncbi:MAG: ParB/RepB/Spo0J family partition protein [Bdellovibrionales bacterium]|nr:ParB/RepB/Spo0J family partition protein [Bdellovibrionales bacterium]
MSTTPTKSVLGKGLASLLPPATQTQNQQTQETIPAGATLNPAPVSGTQGPVMILNTAPLARPVVDPSEKPGLNRDRHPGIAVLEISEIKANEFQPRRDFDEQALEELAQSIRENGLIQPLVVRKAADGYELIAGERRLRASKIAGLKMVPVVIRKSTDREALELAIVENIQREDLNCVDEALAYFQLMQEFQLSQEDLAKRMGKDRATIANALRVLKLSDFILVELKKGHLSRGHAKALLSVEDVAQRENLAKEILEKSLSVRQAERSAQELKGAGLKSAPQTHPSKSIQAPEHEIAKYTQELTRRYMAKVEIKGSSKSGQIQLKYSSKEELFRLMGILMGDA